MEAAESRKSPSPPPRQEENEEKAESVKPAPETREEDSDRPSSVGEEEKPAVTELPDTDKSSLEDTQQSVPSVEVSDHGEGRAEEKSPDGESGINLLSAIEEERSGATSVSELIDTEVQNQSENEVEENILDEASGELLKLQKPTGNVAFTISNDEEKLQENEEAAGPTETRVVDHMVTKENQVLKARVSEINEQLQKSQMEIEVMRKRLDEFECDNELKNPKLLLSKLETQQEENEELKQKIVRQEELIESASEKQVELTEKIETLLTEDETRLRNLKQKQQEVERLESKVAELASVIQSMSSSQDELTNENGLSTSNAIGRSQANSRTSLDRARSNESQSRRPKRSRICVIL